MLNGAQTNIKTGGDFEAIPADKYTVIISNVNLIEQQKFQSVEIEEVLNYEMIVLDNKFLPEKPGDKIDHPIMGRKLWKRCRQALNDKSWLGKLVKAAYGRELTASEKEAFISDPESIVGKQVDLMVEQTESKGNIYNNIISFAKCSKELMVIDEIKAKVAPKEGDVIVKSSVPVNAPEQDAQGEDEEDSEDLKQLKKEVDEASKE